MARVKRGVTSHAKHKKVLEQAKGFSGRRKNTIRTAKAAVDRAGPATPIGISCRLCPRPDCDQRAFPPSDRAIAVEPDVRRVVPYRVV